MFSSNRKTTMSVELQRLDVESQARFDWLLDQNNERRLTLAEREELQGLVTQYENFLLQNTEALLRTTRPDLVCTDGRINRVHLTNAARCTLASSTSPAVPERHSLGKRNMPQPQLVRRRRRVGGPSAPFDAIPAVVRAPSAIVSTTTNTAPSVNVCGLKQSSL